MVYLEALKKLGKPLVIGGDARADSPGHCAKFGSYTVMDLEHHHILNIELVQVCLDHICALYIILNYIRAMRWKGATTWKKKGSLEIFSLLKRMG